MIKIWEADDLFGPQRGTYEWYSREWAKQGEIPLYDKEPEIVYAEREIYNDNQRAGS